MKWVNCDNVEFTRGNYTLLMVKFNNSKVWLVPDFYCTTNTFKSFARKLGCAYNAKVAEIRLFEPICKPVEAVKWNGKYAFRYELRVPNGKCRQFKYYDDSEIWENSIKQKEMESLKI